MVLTDFGQLTGDALRDSYIIQEHVSSHGFDWPDIEGVFDKVHEELGELKDAWRRNDARETRDELGDVLFALVNLARFLDADPAAALADANARFTRRCDRMEQLIEQRGLSVSDCDFATLNQYWDQAKKNGGPPL